VVQAWQSGPHHFRVPIHHGHIKEPLAVGEVGLVWETTANVASLADQFFVLVSMKNALLRRSIGIATHGSAEGPAVRTENGRNRSKARALVRESARIRSVDRLGG